jgi:hypothetical protein
VFSLTIYAYKSNFSINTCIITTVLNICLYFSQNISLFYVKVVGKQLFLHSHIMGREVLITISLSSYCGNLDILPDSIDNGIVDCISLGKERAPDGGQRADFSTFEDASVVRDKVWCPSKEPQ